MACVRGRDWSTEEREHWSTEKLRVSVAPERSRAAYFSMTRPLPLVILPIS